MQLPEISFGTANIAGMYNSVSHKQANDVLQVAWDAGIRYFDTAPHYGHGLSERRLGDFLRNQNSDEWILSTKVGRILKPSATIHEEISGFKKPLSFDQHFDFSYDGIMRSVEDSFQRLGLNRIDILFVHDLGDVGHGSNNQIYYDQFEGSGHKALSELKSQGVIKAVGLGVNQTDICERLIGNVEMDLILLAGRYTLLEQEDAFPLFEKCREHNVKFVVGGVFNSGILATGPGPEAHFDYEIAPDHIQKRVASIMKVCETHNIQLPAAALNFPKQHELVASTLIGTAKVSSLTRNIDVFNQKIPDSLWSDLEKSGLIVKENS